MRIITTDFVNLRGQQNFEDDEEINPVEIKIENNKIQNMFDKYKKNSVKFILGRLLFPSAIKNETGIGGCKIQPHKGKTISNNWRN